MINRLLVLVSVCILANGCVKTPVADFSTDKQEYISGENILLHNLSKETVNIVWTLPDGSQPSQPDPLYYIPDNTGFNSVNISLKAYSKKNKKHSTCTKTVKILPQSVVTAPKHVKYNHCTQSVSNGITRLTFSNDSNIINSYPYDSYLQKFILDFKGSPASGTYTITQSPNNQVGLAFVSGPDNPHYGTNALYLVSIGGQVYINEVNSHLHIVFTNVPTQYSGFVLTGEFFLPNF